MTVLNTEVTTVKLAWLTILHGLLVTGASVSHGPSVFTDLTHLILHMLVVDIHLEHHADTAGVSELRD